MFTLHPFASVHDIPFINIRSNNLVILALPIAYLPQYVITSNYGTYGISTHFLLHQAFFSTAQLALRHVNYAGRRAVRCILSSDLQGIKAFSALVGDLQVLVQWLCTIIWVAVYLVYQTNEDHDAERAPLLLAPTDEASEAPPQHAPTTNKTTQNISSEALFIILFAHSATLLGISLSALLAPEGKSLGRDLGLDILPLYLTDIFQAICMLLGVVYVCILCTAQIRDARANPGAKSISKLSLALQIVILSVIALLHLARPRRNGWWWPQFMDQWALSINYGVLVMTNIVTLYVRVFGSEIRQE